ncbi:MAG: hypothetical protein IT293_15010 [Deltaproteobacteria bacterium]|nr:hypothetical protein [Deltaproteobacteria bacterium]
MRCRCRAAFAALLLASVAATPGRAHEGRGAEPHPAGTPAAGAAATPRAGAAAAPGAGAAAPGPVPVAYRIRPEARADLGWTGIAHDEPWPSEQRLAFALDCGAGGPRCAAVGGRRGDSFGAPIPLSSGGVPACVVNRLRTGVGGSVDPQTGCGELLLHLASAIYTGDEVARPCPACRGDGMPNDGKRDGRCQGGRADGQPCDAQGASSDFGATSNDCEPASAKSAGDLTIDLAPLTTGTAALAATLVCKVSTGKDAPRCFCPAQVQANPCVGDRCAADGRCPEGPVDGACSTAPYRDCRPGTGREDCDAVAPGSGECRLAERPCFGETITATGRCDPTRPTYVAVFCTPQTRAAALNSSAGLPGPSRLVLPLERVE